MKSIQRQFYSAISICLIFFACNNSANTGNQNGRKNIPGYQLVDDWPQLPKSFILSQVTGIGIDTSQNIFLFHRAGREWTEPFPDSLISLNAILLLDSKTGRIINSWGANLFIMPHGLTVDKDDNVWVTDVGLQQVFKFNHDGKLSMTLGVKKTAGHDTTHFNLPTDIALASDGSFYVSDGYGNSRIIKFSKEGHYLFEWGKRGSQQGEFHTPHGIDVDAYGNVYVADRDNNRIQKFSAEGKFLAEWKNDKAEQLYSLSIDKKNNSLFAIDYLTALKIIPKGSDIMVFDSTMTLAARFGRTGFYSGPLCRYHDIAIDNDGNIYTADILRKIVQKFRKVVN